MTYLIPIVYAKKTMKFSPN